MPKIYEQKNKTGGSSWLVALPKDLFKAKGIDPGDEIDFKLDNGDIIVFLVRKGEPTKKEASKKTKKKKK